MADAARGEILANIRSALSGEIGSHKSSPHRDLRTAAPNDNTKIPKPGFDSGKPSRSDLVERFESEFARIGGNLHRATDGPGIRRALNEIALGLGARKIVAWTHPDLENSGLFDLLTGLGIEVHAEGKGRGPQHLVQEAAASDIGITTVDYALADTGTLVEFAAIGRPRCFSLLPPVHVAILPVGRILRGLGEFFSILASERESGGRQLPSAVTFITGPSRTGDIELTLVVGVHGPQELHVVLLDDE